MAGLLPRPVIDQLHQPPDPIHKERVGRFVDQREDLANALALNAMLINAARFIGPPLAGLLLGMTGEATCFALNALSYLGLLAGLLAAQVGGPAALVVAGVILLAYCLWLIRHQHGLAGAE
ncbi:MFS transporter [Pseudomonas borbori]|uniref:Transmembrane secretion effector n=1 Tax=Pseudomonas borbori TaxID=289003 RepID=A0A1I5LNM6_9PSED|nr:Transmembrane secretion effector [Pseudomonas borbori]